MTQTTLTNHPKPQNKAEEKFVDCMKNGNGICKIGRVRPRKAKKEGDDANVISAKMIRHFVLGSDNLSLSQGGEKIISLTGAWVDGGLNLALADIRTSMLFDKCHFGNKIHLGRTKLLSLCMNNCRLTEGLDGRRAQVRGDLAIRLNSSIKGEVDLSAASIDGGVDFAKSIFPNLRHHAGLSIGGAHIGKSLSLKKGRFYGTVYINNTHIGGNLDCSHARFKGYLSASLMEVKKSVIFSRAKGTGDINLVFSKTGVLIDNMPDKKLKFHLNGFTYNQFGTPGTFKSRISWLKSWQGAPRFYPQPFEQAAKVLFTMGHDRDAREILLAKEQSITGELSGWRKHARQLWDVLAGYGHRLGKTLLLSAACIVSGAIVFGYADHLCRIVPSQPAMVVDSDYRNANTRKCTTPSQPTKAVADMYPAYPRFNYVIYSLDVFIPFFALSQEPYWQPQPEEGDTEIIVRISRYWYWFEVIAGWVLTSLLVLSATGLLRPRQSSGGE